MSKELDKKLLHAKTAEEIAFLLASGADVNAKDDTFGKTALMYAIDNNDIEQIKLLIDNGADVNAKDNNGVTPLMLAKTAEQTELLIKKGANVNAVDKHGRSAMMYIKTAEQGKLLMANGAKVLIDHSKDRGSEKTELGFFDTQRIRRRITKMLEKQPKREEEKKKPTKSATRPLKGKKSGVVYADAIANMKRSGIIKGDVTPEMAKKLKEKMTRE